MTNSTVLNKQTKSASEIADKLEKKAAHSTVPNKQTKSASEIADELEKKAAQLLSIVDILRGQAVKTE